MKPRTATARMSTIALAAAALGAIVCLTSADETTLPDGPYQEYHSNGKVASEGLIKDGVRTGTWTFYGPTGEVLTKSEFRDGARVLSPAQTFRDDSLGLALTIPPGFDKVPEGTLPKAFLHRYARVDADGRNNRTAIAIEPLSGELSVDASTTEDVRLLVPDSWLSGFMEETRKVAAAADFNVQPDKPEASLVLAKWKTFNARGYAYKIKNEYGAVLIRVVQVPLKNRAINLTTFASGEDPDEKALDKLMTALLASLEGEGRYRLGWPERMADVACIAGVCVTIAFLVRYIYRRGLNRVA
jgi:hypothetical protein